MQGRAMQIKSSGWLLVAAIFAGCWPLLLSVGCSREDAAALQTVARLRAIAAAYLDVAVASGVGPADELQLRKQMAQSLAVISLAQAAGSDSIDGFLVSARDGTPFKLRFGLPISQTPGGGTIAMERTGADGSRYVAFSNGVVECVPESSVQPLLGAL
jgi:hypothetical protein